MRRGSSAAALLAVTCLLGGPLVAASGAATTADTVTALAAPAAPTYYSATNYQVNAAHTGLAPGSSLPTNLKRLWTKDFAGALSYPLVVGSRVFVTAAPAGDTTGAVRVFAFDKRTGRQLWRSVAVQGRFPTTSLAYGSGRLIALNSDGRVRALDPGTGRVSWSKRLRDPNHPTELVSADKPVTVRAGVAYVVTAYSGYTYTALNVLTGKTLWVKRDQIGALAPAVDATRVHLVANCEQDSYTLTGRLVWSHDLGCQGGVSGTSAVLAAGRIWVRTESTGRNAVLDARTGLAVSTFLSSSAPVIVGGRAFLTRYDPSAPWDVRLHATDRVTGAELWSRQPDPEVNGQIVGESIATRDVVYVRTSRGRVFGYRTTTGKQVWSGSTGTSFDPQAGNAGSTITSSAVGGGVLAVPLANRLTIFG